MVLDKRVKKMQEEEMYKESPGNFHGKEEGVLIRKLELHPKSRA